MKTKSYRTKNGQQGGKHRLIALLVAGLWLAGAGTTLAEDATSTVNMEASKTNGASGAPEKIQSGSGSPANAGGEPEAGEEAFKGNQDETEIISFEQFVKDSQIKHEQMLIDKFLFAVSLVFLILAGILYRTLPPRKEES